MRYYAGIGSRETPEEIQNLMEMIAEKLESLGYCLRSGHADGADAAFEAGVVESMEIYLPWQGFNHADYTFGISKYEPKYWAFAQEQVRELLGVAHWNRLSEGGKKLHTRNFYQIFGETGVAVDFVICWTPRGIPSGGTRTAIKLAEKHGIPVYNLGDPAVKQRLCKFVN